MFKFIKNAARILAVGLSVSIPLMAAASAAELKVLVIDQQEVLRNSLAGQDIGRQATVLRDQIAGEVQAEQLAIVNGEKDLTSNASVYSPAQRDQKIKALEARKRAYPVFEQRKTQILQMSITNASNQVAAALRPILQKLIDENKATLLLDRAQVMYATPSYDVTAEAIKRLNATLKNVKVERVNLDTATAAQTSAPSTIVSRPASASSPKPAQTKP